MEAALDKWLWRQEYWLPEGVTWEDMKDSEDVHYPKPRDLLIGIPCALVFTAVRFVFERYVALPLSRCLDVRQKSTAKAEPNRLLERFYTTESKCPTEVQVCSLSKQCDLRTRQVHRWFRLRRNQDRPSLTKKFCEASWRFVFYFCSFFTGLILLHDKPWFWDQKEFWTGFPHQALIPSLYWYYIIELGFYSSLLITVVFDVKRKDLKEQIIHHFATIFLITFSYCANYIRAGTVVMLLHDASDILLEPAKMFNYTKFKRVCDVLFVIFAVIFFITRLVVLPCRVIYSTYYQSMELFKPFFGYYFFNALLLVLQVLHIFWGYFIVRMAYRLSAVGTVEKDMRSDVEESDGSGNEEEAPGDAKQNGITHLRQRPANCKPSDLQKDTTEPNGIAQLANGHSMQS
ncbi:ceramide synthase 2-like [Ambystoma mexicanum]|uniref:ceramide synthase 2-like n=1 Tax=Ambystoma mexicanum TaxID=8296 RepID=UPI0037E753AD